MRIVTFGPPVYRVPAESRQALSVQRSERAHRLASSRPSLDSETRSTVSRYKKRRTMPVINKEALELLPKLTGTMAYQQAAKGNWSGVLLGFLLGEMLAGLTVNTRMGWLTVWLPLVLPAGFVILRAVFAEIRYHRAVRRYRPSTPSATPPPPQPSLPTELSPPLSPAEVPPPLPLGLNHSGHNMEWPKE